MVSLLCALAFQQTAYFESPAKSRFAEIVYDGETVLPNGRLLTPLGKRMYTMENLWRVTLSPDERTAVGIHDAGLSIFDLSQNPPKQRVVPYKDGSLCGSFSKDGSSFIMGGGESGDLVVFDTTTWEIKQRISIKDTQNADPFIVDLALSKDGRRVFAIDIAHQRVVSL
ncbi:MAG TPA: WD40 repeat domain-containing protein, partial [Fimbriimonas sp.]|nr:WD40 repeat domain-containing protein [Fimbriimonas sp.]